MAKKKALKIAAGIVGSFAVLAGTIIYLAAAKTVRFEVAMLLLVALLGMYIGFGILIAVYRLIEKID